MKEKETNQNEINDFLLSESLKRNPFLVPKDYFSTLKEEIIFKKDISKFDESSFIVPQNYQESLSQDILSKISEEKLKQFIPDHEFSVPADYFDNLQKKILIKTVGTKDLNTKELIKNVHQKKSVKQLGIKKWMPHVAAATIAIAIGLIAILEKGNYSGEQDLKYLTHIEAVPTDEIINYLAYYSEVGDLQYLSEQLQNRPEAITEGLSSEEIEAYLEYGL